MPNRIIGTCRVCGVTEEIWEITQIDMTKVVMDFGSDKTKITPDTILSVKHYCNTHFLEYVWFKTKKEQDND